jgi:hypothetical protein
MTRMRVTHDEAMRLIRQIPHATCQRGLDRRWIAGGVAGVTAQSICWLYCWAKTGMNSLEAASTAQGVFDAIFEPGYDWFDGRVDHEWARRVRYQTGDLERDLREHLARRGA